LHPDNYMEVTHVEAMNIDLPHSMREIIKKFNTKCKTPEGVYTEILSNLQGRFIAGDEILWLNYLEQVTKKKTHCLISFINYSSSLLKTMIKNGAKKEKARKVS